MNAGSLRAVQSLDDWIAEGEGLGSEERAAATLMWRIGDWWNQGEAHNERSQAMTTAGWKGPAPETCRVAGWVAARWPAVRRRTRLSFEHHKAVAALDEDEAVALLDWAEEETGDDDEPRSRAELRARVKQVKRAKRESALGGKIREDAERLGHEVYGVLYADPPWRFEPYSRETGMDRAADNHYPTMTAEELAALDIAGASAADAIMFCWATVAMLPAGMTFLADHGFAYRSAYFWLKPGPGTGYWSTTDQVEVLLVGTKGEVPAPAQGAQPPQCQTFPRSRHSEKPDAFADMIVRMYPSLPRVELFARKARADWSSWGAEAP